MSFHPDENHNRIGSRVKGLKARIGASRLKLVSPSFADLDTLANTLNATIAGHRTDCHIADARFLVTGFKAREAASLIVMLQAAGARSCSSCSDVAKLCEAADVSGAFTHIMVNLDAFDDMNDAVSALLLFRMRQKGIVVILISDAVKQDDLFQDRKWICDATMRAPVSMKRLCEGLLAAWTNNIAFNC